MTPGYTLLLCARCTTQHCSELVYTDLKSHGGCGVVVVYLTDYRTTPVKTVQLWIELGCGTYQIASPNHKYY